MKKIHFIGICGVAMSALTIALNKKGYKISGSDKGFYPPISTHLKKTNINFYPGWHPEKMSVDGDPDLVVVGNVAGSNNPEWVYVQEHNLKYVSYPELLAKFFVKQRSIVCAGTYGKTTTSTLLSLILIKAGLDPSYMFGGLSLNDIDSASLTDGQWSILEGDEYKTARWDISPKFAHYSPTHLLLTSMSWDHADIYKTEQDYFDAFKKLIKSIPKDGMTVACMDDENVKQMSALSNSRVVTYGNSEGDYTYSDINQTKDGISFQITLDGKSHSIHAPVLGEFMAQNIAGCFAMAHSIGIDQKVIVNTIENFKGIKRRLEKRLDSKITIFDDIAHSPAKANFTLKTLRNIYSGKITAIFEPNTGNRKSESILSYEGAFEHADEVILPRLTRIKIDPNDSDKPMDGEDITEVIKKSHKNVKYIENDEELISYVSKRSSDGDVIVFLGSHGFRGMIEGLIDELD